MTTGLYEKYRVQRTDGKPLTGRVFVLQPETDPHARAALRAYADSLSASNPENTHLIDDILHWLAALEGDGDATQ